MDGVPPTPPTPHAPLVHIIAAPEDAGRIAPIAALLAGRGFATHIATTPPPSPPLLALLAVAPASNQSPTVREVAERALAVGARVTPLILSARDDTPTYLARLQWVDFSGAFESGWLALLAALDRAGVTRYPPAPGWLDWEVALARAYRGHLPPDWRAYRISPSYYALRARNILVQMAGVILVMAIMTTYPLTTLSTLDPLHTPLHNPISLAALTFLAGGLIILASWLIKRTLTSAGDYRRGLASRDDRSEMIILTPDGFGLRANQRDTVRQFSDLAALEQTPDPPRRRDRRNPDLDPERGTRRLGTVYGALQLTRRDGLVETIALGDRFPDRALIVRQVVELFHQSQMARGANGALPQAASVAPVFISHARKDHVAVDRMDETLRLAGYQTWVDRNMLAGGQEWSRELQQAIASSAAVIVALSPAALASPMVRAEYEEALRLGKPVLVVVLRRTRAMPDILRARRCASLTGGVDEGAWGRGWAPLLVALRRVGAWPTDPTAFNARRVLAEALAGDPRPDWRTYRIAPAPINLTVLTLVALALIPFGALLFAVTLGAPNWLSLILLEMAIMLALICAVQARPMIGLMWRLVVTPEGAAVLRGDALDSYAWSDYSAARLARRSDPSRALYGNVLLRMRETGREQRMLSVAQFIPQSSVKPGLLASFHAYQAARTPPAPSPIQPPIR